LKTFDIAPFLLELSNNILSGQASVGVKLHIDAIPMSDGLNFAIPLGMMVNELVTNSLKHAFPAQEGRIMVSLRPDTDGNLVLVVSDDGRGQSVSTMKRARPGVGEKDGVDAAIAIHEVMDTKTIFITGSKEPKTVARIQLDHPEAVLFKPISDSQLHTAVEAALRG
jgi:LytS/YehU family sensor histidine kinase